MADPRIPLGNYAIDLSQSFAESLRQTGVLAPGEGRERLKQRQGFLQQLVTDFRRHSQIDAVKQTETELGSILSERNTWLLVEMLLLHELYFQPKPQPGDMAVDRLASPDLKTEQYREMVDELMRNQLGSTNDDAPGEEEPYSHSAIARMIVSGDRDLARHLLVVRWLERVHEDELRDSRALVEWLEDDPSARLSDEAFASRPEKDRYMERTRKLKLYATDRDSSGAVDSLDPDAMTRERKRVEQQDIEEDALVMKGVWKLIRSGKIDRAIQYCRHHGQYWRSSTLEGGRWWYLKRTRDAANGTESFVQGGNPRRFLWQDTCKKLSESDGASNYEQAVYGSLGGNIDKVLPHCNSWEDMCWLLFRKASDDCIQQKFIQEVQKYTHPAFDTNLVLSALSGPTVPAFGPALSKETPAQLFQKLEHNQQKRIRDASADPYHRLQQLLVRGDYDGVIRELARTIESFSQSGATPGLHQPSYIRFAAHLALHLTSLLRLDKPDLSDAKVSILLAYILQLIDANMPELVAKYAAFLPEPQLLHLYANILKGISDSSKRNEYLTHAKRHFPKHVPTITNLMVQQFMAESAEDASRSVMPSPLTPAVLSRLRTPAVQPSTRQLHALASPVPIATPSRDLPPATPLSTLRGAPTPFGMAAFPQSQPRGQFSSSPTGYGGLTQQSIISEMGLDENPQRMAERLGVDSASAAGDSAITAADNEKIKAIMCYENLDTPSLIQLNTLLRQFVMKDKIAAAKKLCESARRLIITQDEFVSSDHEEALRRKNVRREYESWCGYITCLNWYTSWNQLHYSRPAHHERGPSADMSFEYQQQQQQLRRENEIRVEASEYFKRTLTTEGGWMKDIQGLSDPARDSELAKVRQKCIPELVILLNTIYYKSRCYAESHGLATLVADDTHALFSAFTPDQLRFLLRQFAESQIRLLQQNTEAPQQPQQQHAQPLPLPISSSVPIAYRAASSSSTPAPRARIQTPASRFTKK